MSSAEKKLVKICVVGKQHGTTIYETFMSPEEFKDCTYVDLYRENLELDEKQRQNTGFQRHRKDKVLNNFAKKIKSDICIDAPCLNDRKKEIEIKPIAGMVGVVKLIINKGTRLSIPDGQARILGLIRYWEKCQVEGSKAADNFMLPVVITQVDVNQERRCFVTINDNIEKVDRAHRAMIKLMSFEDKGIIALQTEDEKTTRDNILEVLIIGAVKQLNQKSSSPLFDMFYAKEVTEHYRKKDIKKNPQLRFYRQIPTASFLNAYRYVDSYLHDVLLKNERSLEKKIVALVDYEIDYWTAMREVTTEISDMSKIWENPSHYTFFCATGLAAHALLFKHLIEIMQKSKEEINKDNFYKYLSKISLLRKRIIWYNVKGFKADPLYRNISMNDPVVEKTFANKRGTSYGTNICDIMKEQLKTQLEREQKTA